MMATNAERSVRGDIKRRDKKIKDFVESEFKNYTEADRVIAALAIFRWGGRQVSSNKITPAPGLREAEYCYFKWSTGGTKSDMHYCFLSAGHIGNHKCRCETIRTKIRSRSGERTGMMNGCEYLKCGYWDGEKCTDPNEYVNDNGPCCGHRADARPITAPGLREAAEKLLYRCWHCDYKPKDCSNSGCNLSEIRMILHPPLPKAALEAEKGTK